MIPAASGPPGRRIMKRQHLQFPAKDVPLRDDVHALGALVGEVVRDQCGEHLFQMVEADRRGAIALYANENGSCDAGPLRARVSGRSPAQAQDLVRAFSTWFQVVNLAEKVHRVRRRREYLNDARGPQPGSLTAAVTALRAQGVSLDAVREMLARTSIYPVFTAHPTASTRRTLLRKQQRIADLLLMRLDDKATVRERHAVWEQIRTELTSGWQTEEQPRARRTVGDEREHVLFYVAEILYRIVPRFYEELAAALSTAYSTPVSAIELPMLVQVGSWVGGDMDGHPDVHGKTIRETLQRQHKVVLNAYFLEVQRLGERLSQSASRVQLLPELEARSREYTVLLPGVGAGSSNRYERMPYRIFCAQIAERLRATFLVKPGHYDHLSEFESDIDLMARSLATHAGTHAGLFYVHRLKRRARTFGFHLATLDVRQHADVHHSVVAQGLGDPEWASRLPEDRTRRLQDALDRDLGPTHEFDAVGRRSLAVFDALVHCRHRFGQRSIGDYVVSGAAGADDVLAVLLLARWAEMTDKHTAQVPLDVAPLFESVGALADAPRVMGELLQMPVYRAHLAARGNRQTVMIGYFDSNKESGFAAARWALHRAQDEVAKVLDAGGVELTVFHGRGGATSRGGGRLGSLARSAPPGAFRGALRATEQGESIDLAYGLRPIALRTLEQAWSAIALALSGADQPPPLDPQLHAAMETISVRSRAVYRELVHKDRDFYDYFRAASPIDVIERMNIDTLPALRDGKQGLDALRAVPWGFAWSQNRHLLPGWYGVGSGLEAVAERYGEDMLSALLAGSTLFQTLIADVELTLAKADIEVSGWYAELAGAAHARHFAQVREEFDLTRERVLRLRGEARLLDGEPTMQRAIELRNPYTDPMHLMQIDLLRRWRATDRADKDLFDALLASINGISQGLQATG